MTRRAWAPEVVARFWDHMADDPRIEDTYFSKVLGRGIVEVARRRAGLTEGMAVLDYGCGPGNLAVHLLAAGCEVWGVDQSPRSMEQANDRFAAEARWHGAATDVDRADFDLVTCIETVEHLDDDALLAVLGEVRSHLGPGGRALFTTPNDERIEDGLQYCPFCDTEFHHMQHVRAWTATSLGHTLEQHGFVVDWVGAVDLRTLQPVDRRSWKTALGDVRARIRPPAVLPNLVAVARASAQRSRNT